jgi:uncharacterized membrane protein
MKIINVILGLGTAIILGALVNLGIAAFHPAPVPPDYNAIVTPAAVYPYPAPCAAGDVACSQKVDAYNAQQQKQQQEFNKENDAYQNALKVYNRDVFIIANVVGIIIFIAGFLVLFMTSIVAQSVPIGIMIAGLWSIIYGYMRGWGSTNDQLKFFVGLVIAALVIGGSIWLIERYQKKRATA